MKCNPSSDVSPKHHSCVETQLDFVFVEHSHVGQNLSTLQEYSPVVYSTVHFPPLNCFCHLQQFIQEMSECRMEDKLYSVLVFAAALVLL